MSIKIGIVEDTLEYIETLRFLLSQQPQDTVVVQEASDLVAAKALLLNPVVDLAFLDIQLQGGTIFDVLDELVKAGETLPEIVFVTAHGSFEYATKAIRFASLDFISKPVSEDALQAALERFQQKQKKDLQNQQVGFLLDLLKGNMNAPKSIGVVLPKGIIEFVELEEVVYFKADANVCDVKLANSKNLTSTKHLGYYTDLLTGNAEFVQISKNCLLNSHYIKRYDHREKSISLKNGDDLVVSHRFAKQLRKVLLNQGEPSFFGKISQLFR